MRAGRQLVTELELWHLNWQQIETFADRIESARDQDADDANRFAALLDAAGVVERQRALVIDAKPLGDPVINQPPLSDAPPASSLAAGWQRDYRIWRIPGNDELELAVANLIELPGEGEDPVVLLAPSDFYSYKVDPAHPAYADSDNGIVTVRAPSYPGITTSTIAGSAVDAGDGTIAMRALTPGLKEDNASPWANLIGVLIGASDGETLSSLFPPNHRGHAARDIDHTEEWLLSWSALTSNRRDNRHNAAEADVNYFSIGAEDVAWNKALSSSALALAASARSNVPLATGIAGASLAASIASAAELTVALIGADAERLRTAAEALEDIGINDPGLPAILQQAADGFGNQPALFTTIATTARTLQSNLSVPLGSPISSSLMSERVSLGNLLALSTENLIAALSGGGTLFNLEVERGPLHNEIDDAAATRIAYPDGSLRILRALEEAFVRFWPGKIRWFRERLRLSLDTRFRRFRAPFVQGLSALLHGGDTGFPVGGLSLLVPATTRSTRLDLEQPASLVSALGDVQAGHIALFTGTRHCAALVVGVASREGRISLDVQPLRISILPAAVAEADDSLGMIVAGSPLGTFMPGAGLTDDALRRGMHPSEPAYDGIVESAVTLYSQLALVFGWQLLEEELGASVPLYANRSLPDSSSELAESLQLYGHVPANSSTLVLRGAGSAFWDNSDPANPEPSLARPGEYLLMQGRTEYEGAPGPLSQAAIEVQASYRTTVKAFNRMDTSSAALLSTSPFDTNDVDACLANCEPEENLIVLTLARTWQRNPYVADISIRRDFHGFDAPSLACGKLLPISVVDAITTVPTTTGFEDVDRSAEFAAANNILENWLRFTRR